QRMLEGIRVHLQRGTPWPLLALGVAGWMRYVSGVDDAGQAIDIRDPLTDKFRAIVDTSEPGERVPALLTLTEIFGSDLPSDPVFVEAIQSAWSLLAAKGAHQAVIDTLSH